MREAAAETVEGTDAAPRTYDVVVIGAGFSGLHALYALREAGYDVLGVEAGDGVGGTWHWNRYPGARVDLESMQYSYSFDEDLQQEWHWPERFSPQPDLEAYANHVADRFGLRGMILFSHRVDRLRFDDATETWHVHSDGGAHLVARFVVAATGSLDATYVPPWPGVESFAGVAHHTSAWPKDGVDLVGKRVGLVGTGSSGIQATPVVAADASHLVVFQRTPHFTIPSRNEPLDPVYEREWKANYAERRRVMRQQRGALLPGRSDKSVFDYSPEEREAIMEQVWRSGGGFRLIMSFRDVLTDPAANEIVADFVRNKIHETVHDPEVAERLTPRTYPIGTKRICVDSGYYETFNRDNVTLVDVRAEPIVEVVPEGLRTTARTYDLDVLIFATGFDAMSGPLLRMNVTGAGGVALTDRWRDGPTSFLGLMVAGFPNLFMIHGPGSPSVLAQMIAVGEDEVNWVVRVIQDLHAKGVARLDTTVAAEEAWRGEVTAAAEQTLYPRADSWYVGANIPGKPRVFMVYLGGADRYIARCHEQVDKGYEGFILG